MRDYVAKRIKFQNGERLSVLEVRYGLPVHEVTLYLDTLRTSGRAANTLHAVCSILAILYNELDRAKIDLHDRFGRGQFLTSSELSRLASIAQLRVDDIDKESAAVPRSNKVNVARISMRLKKTLPQRVPVDVATQAIRLRYFAKFLSFFAYYVSVTLSPSLRSSLEKECDHALRRFKENIPAVSQRAKLHARIGLSLEEQTRVASVIQPDHPDNPWKESFVRQRNAMIVILLLATGMRKGELLGLQIGDLDNRESKLSILRRADTAQDARRVQPNTKTYDRVIAVLPANMKRLWEHINSERREILPARKIPQIFVSDDGKALSSSSIDKIFNQLRAACPGLPVALTCHVMRHTWNERFSEVADKMGLSETEERYARNQQQGWKKESLTSAEYTRRHAAAKGNEISLKLQEELDESLRKSSR